MKPFFSHEDIKGCSGKGTLELSDYLNGLIAERGKVVWGRQRVDVNRKAMIFFDEALSGDTHQALLICVEEIEKPDTAEQILAELATYLSPGDCPQIHSTTVSTELLRRAKKLLSEGKK